MSTVLIEPYKELEKLSNKGIDFKKEEALQVAEFFCNTVQGEGVTTGVLATFLRLTGCTLDCVFCDSVEVWRRGRWFTFDELFEIMEGEDVIEKLREEQHLVITGGSPLKQQKQLIKFLEAFKLRYGFIPYIEVENECVLRIEPEFCDFVSQWNNSPKLSNSGMKERVRIKPEIIAHTAKMNNSWFKFVIERKEDWEEIEKDYLSNGVSKRQIVLMPCGASREELSETRGIVADMAIKHGVRYSDRLHVILWNKKVGV